MAMTKGNTTMELYNRQFSRGTLNPTHLLEAATTYVSNDMHHAINKVLGDSEQEQMVFWVEEVYPALSELSPEGYYFGNTDGDGSDIGWWKIDPDEFYPSIDEQSCYTLVKKQFDYSYHKMFIIEKAGSHDPWKYRTQLDIESVILDKDLYANDIALLCRYEDEHVGSCEDREKEMLTQMMDYQSTQDEQFQYDFVNWWQSHGFAERAQRYHL